MPKEEVPPNAELREVQETIRQLQEQLARTGRVEIGFHHGYFILILSLCGSVGALALYGVVTREGDEALGSCWVMLGVCAVPAAWAIWEWRTGRPILVVTTQHVTLPRRGLAIPWSAVLGAWTQHHPKGANVKIRVDPQQFPSIRKPVNVPGSLAIDESAVGWWLGREASARRHLAPDIDPA